MQIFFCPPDKKTLSFSSQVCVSWYWNVCDIWQTKGSWNWIIIQQVKFQNKAHSMLIVFKTTSSFSLDPPPCPICYFTVGCLIKMVKYDCAYTTLTYVLFQSSVQKKKKKSHFPLFPLTAAGFFFLNPIYLQTVFIFILLEEKSDEGIS